MNVFQQGQKLVVPVLLTFTVLWLLFGVADFWMLAKLVAEANWFLLLLALVLHAVNVLFASLRLNALESSLSFLECFFGTSFGLMLSDFTPGRIGFLASVDYVRGVGRSRVLRALLVGQMMEFSLKALALVFLTAFSVAVGGVLAVVVFLVVLVACGLLFSSKRMVWLLASFLGRLPLAGVMLKRYHYGLSGSSYSAKTLLSAYACSVFGLAACVLRWITVLYALGLSVDLARFVVTFYVLSVLNFVPTIGGIGGVESGLVLSGIAAGWVLVSFALVDRAVYVTADVLLGLVAVLRRGNEMRV